LYRLHRSIVLITLKEVVYSWSELGTCTGALYYWSSRWWQDYWQKYSNI